MPVLESRLDGWLTSNNIARKGEAREQHVSHASFFDDMPWLNVSKDRQTIFIEPLRNRGGLLGGASTPSKMSKLQALAAARKKKADDQKSEEKLRRVTQHLGNLSTAPELPESTKENVRPLCPSPGEVEGLTGAGKTIIPERASFEQVQVSDKRLQDQPEIANQLVQPLPVTASSPLLVATPSSFARALLRPTTSSAASSPKTYSFPYMNVTSSSTDAFSAPSPDDVVLKAQSQGSLIAKKVAKSGY